METEAVLTFESVDEILWCYHSNENSSAVLSPGTIYLVCSSNSFESVNQILWCYHSDETSSAVLSHGTVKLVCSSNLFIIFFRIMITLIKYLFSSISEILA